MRFFTTLSTSSLSFTLDNHRANVVRYYLITENIYLEKETLTTLLVFLCGE